jgi:predicted RNA-binding Zn-ribbon protein involved in translation (DUF1610 family)
LATSSQRAWRAACPNCGAPVEFASAASASAVCSFCRSTLLRDGETLRRIGVVAELFDDHSPLQLGATGQRQGIPFTLVGRLQYGYRNGLQSPAAPAPPPGGAAGPTGKAGSDLDGTWNEWHALFDNGPGLQRSGWLSEDNGAYVFAFDTPLAEAPAAVSLQAGQRVNVGGQAWDVASVVSARLISAQGELPSPPQLQGAFTVVDLRNPRGEVGTLDYGDPQRVGWSIGRAVAFSELALRGLREADEKTLASRALECPSCGASLVPTLATTQSLSCPQCQAVVDISKGAGADLAHYAQNNSGSKGLGPQIALGSTGTLALGGAALPWTVVGYQERCDVPAGGGDEEQTFWREYLLYHRSEGFAFLVDAEDGWSWVRPITGAPAVRGDRAEWQGATYRRRAAYTALVTWVQGEFYWRVQRDERAFVIDYAGLGSASALRLAREQTGNEVTWSAGQALAAATVAQAFGLAAGTGVVAPLQKDVLPALAAGGLGKAVLIVTAIVVLMILVTRCSGDDCDEARSTFGEASREYQQCQRSRNGGGTVGGGSYGGWSSGGGGHK